MFIILKMDINHWSFPSMDYNRRKRITPIYKNK